MPCDHLQEFLGYGLQGQTPLPTRLAKSNGSKPWMTMAIFPALYHNVSLPSAMIDRLFGA